MSPSLYVCEKNGQDSATGSETDPLATAVAALAINEEATIFVRKEGDETFVEITCTYQHLIRDFLATALKRAKKNLETLKKKQQKEAEKAMKDAETALKKKQDEEARLEYARSVQLVQDPSWPVAVKVQ